ncbi:MAG TPA: LLM class flavin-dependent oxidoreductase [Baekduia sp.]|nr:LLM class flavin-dependent oxidoreductase [Baekduia sp.]
MRFSILCALQLPRPWDDGAERRAIRQALEQAQLADRLGYHGLWVLGHHFHEEHAHASAPEVLLGAVAARTERLRLGLAGVATAPAVAHPARIAEAVAMLDVLSDGRVELATTELSSGAEVGGFGLERRARRQAWHEGLGLVARMLAERPFTGAREPHVAMPPRAVPPRPLQRPHPPLWLAGARRESARVAAEHGLGALSLAFLEPDEAAALVVEHRDVLRSERCVPAGLAINDAVAVALPLMVHADEAEAIERGIDGVHFHAYATGHYDAFGHHHPGRTSIWEEFVARRDDVGLARSAVVADGGPLSVRVLGGGLASVRGAVGTPAQVRDLVRRYADAGVDELVLCVQLGRTRHEHVCEALELFAAEVTPAFAASEERHGRGIGDAGRVALARRPPAPALDPAYAFGPDDEAPSATAAAGAEAAEPAPGAALQRLARRRRPRAWARRAAGLRGTLETRGQEAFRRFVASSDDARLERTIGSDAGLRLLFAAMERRFDAQRAGDFEGDIQYDLRVGGTVRRWTVRVGGGTASAQPGAVADAELTLTLGVADLARVATGELDPVSAVLSGRLELHGDFGVAMRLGEMFGQAPGAGPAG